MACWPFCLQIAHHFAGFADGRAQAASFRAPREAPAIFIKDLPLTPSFIVCSCHLGRLRFTGDN